MSRIHLIVEGQTEESFVKNLLTPFFSEKGVFVDARRIVTGRRGVRKFRGGMTSYDRAKLDITTWLKEDSNAFVSTMFDLYGLPTDFPGFSESLSKEPRIRIDYLESKLSEDVNSSRFIPYIQLHEFESLLFSEPAVINELVPGKNCLAKLQAILDEFDGDPELINDDPSTAPSKRIEGLYPRYEKVAYGSRIAGKSGVGVIAQKCSHFAGWLRKLEATKLSAK